MRVTSIAAVATNGVIGKDNDLVWRLREDMRFFMNTTKGHHVIMGRRNFESIPEKYRPLADRPNIVISRNPDYAAPGAIVVTSLEAALELARSTGEEEAFIIGGGQIYRLALEVGAVDRQLLTHVQAEPEGDAFYPTFEESEWIAERIGEQEADERNEYGFEIWAYTRRR